MSRTPYTAREIIDVLSRRLEEAEAKAWSDPPTYDPDWCPRIVELKEILEEIGQDPDSEAT